MTVTSPAKQSLCKRFPHIAKQWHPKKNGSLNPSSVAPFSGKKVWWQCKRGHEWETRITDRSRGRGCPYCAGQKIGSDNNLLAVNPELARQWHPKKNDDLTPAQVMPGTDQSVWWICGKGHEWKARILNRSHGSGCPYCAGKEVGSDNNLAVVNRRLARQWHPAKNGNLRPSDVTPGSGRKVWWQCKRGHEWETQIALRSRGSGCPYCAGRKLRH